MWVIKPKRNIYTAQWEPTVGTLLYPLGLNGGWYGWHGKEHGAAACCSPSLDTWLPGSLPFPPTSNHCFTEGTHMERTDLGLIGEGSGPNWTHMHTCVHVCTCPSAGLCGEKQMFIQDLHIICIDAICNSTKNNLRRHHTWIIFL